MSRGLALCLSLLCLVLVGVMAISCGSSSNTFHTTNCSVVYNVVGDWTLSVSGTGGALSGPGVINSSGLAAFFQTTTTAPAPGDTVVMPSITGTCSFSGTATAYATPGSGGGAVTDTVQGTVSSDVSISGTLSNGNMFSLTPNSPLSGAVTALSGSGWLGAEEGATVPIIWQLALTPTGAGSSMSFAGTGQIIDGSTCHMTGTFNQEGGDVSTLNVFDVSITSLDAGCPIGGTLTGLGFESSQDYFSLNGNATGTYLYAMSSSSDFVFEIFLQEGK